MQGARPLATMIFTLLNWSNSVPTNLGLRRHNMETSSALLGLCEENHRSSPIRRIFDVTFFDISLNNPLNKQWSCRWFETLSRSFVMKALQTHSSTGWHTHTISQRRQPQTLSYNDDVIRWDHFPRYWPFVRGIHRSPVNPPHKVQWRGALMFSLICSRINGWVNNGEAGDSSMHRAHYDVTVMYEICSEYHTKITIVFRMYLYEQNRTIHKTKFDSVWDGG